MRQHIRTMIDEAKRASQVEQQKSAAAAASASSRVESAMSRSAQGCELLAAEAVRLARLATSVHLSRTTEIMAHQHSGNADPSCFPEANTPQLMQESLR